MRKFWALLRCRLTIGLLAGTLVTIGGADTQAVESMNGGDGLVAALQATASNHPALASESAKVLAARYASSAERTQRFPSL